MMAIKKLSDRELNQKLMESMGVKDVEARKAFEEMMSDKYRQIRAEVREEVYEELSKQAKADKERIVESMNQLTSKVIKEEMEKINIHRKNLIKEKLALKEAKENVEKAVADKTAMIKEEFNRKLRENIASMKKNLEEQKADFVEKASKFINESVKKEIAELHSDRRQLGESLSQFGKFIAEQVSANVKKQREEIKSLDALKVRLVKEQNEKVAEAKKKFFAEASEKMSKFIEANVKRELTEFRKDIAESRKKSFGSKIFEAFAKEFAVKFFNEDKVVKGLLESVKASNNKLLHASKVTEEMNAKLIKENKELKAVNTSLTRSKIINESINHLPQAKQEMVKSLVKDVPTNKLVESLNKYIPMVLEGNTNKTINKNRERVLSEGKRLNILTGSNEKQNGAMKRLVSDSLNLTEEMNKEIESIIAQSKL
jgi:hypothetical protein